MTAAPKLLAATVSPYFQHWFSYGNFREDLSAVPQLRQALSIIPLYQKKYISFIFHLKRKYIYILQISKSINMANVINARANNQNRAQIPTPMCKDGTDLIDLTHMTDRPPISLTDRVSSGRISQILGLLLTNGLQIYRSLCFWSKGRTSFNNEN